MSCFSEEPDEVLGVYLNGALTKKVLNFSEEDKLDTDEILYVDVKSMYDTVLIDEYLFGELVERSYFEVMKRKGYEAKVNIIKFLKKVYPEIESLEIIDNVLHIVYSKYSVPIHVAGDGLKKRF